MGFYSIAILSRAGNINIRSNATKVLQKVILFEALECKALHNGSIRIDIQLLSVSEDLVMDRQNVHLQTLETNLASSERRTG